MEQPQELTRSPDEESQKEENTESENQPPARCTESTVQEVGAGICNPRHTAVAACVRMVSRMAGAFSFIRRPGDTSGVRRRSGLCCSRNGLEDILDTHTHRLRPVITHTEAMDLASESQVDKSSARGGVPCTQNMDPSGSKPSPKSSWQGSSSDYDVTGLHSLLQPNNEQPEVCTLEPLGKKREQMHRENNPSGRYKQFDCVHSPVDHHFVDVAQVRPSEPRVQCINPHQPKMQATTHEG